MIKPASYIFSFYKGEYDEEELSIDKDTFRRTLIEPFFISLDIEIETKENNEEDDDND
ncbi:MAG: hypothetical protein H5T91_00090 [Synergistetes bacterium]|nr:MAG: hypothetical protein XD52_0904 [bacterium 42_11]MBC7330815.1 hypothetical protein [Synergistota bacterium]